MQYLVILKFPHDKNGFESANMENYFTLSELLPDFFSKHIFRLSRNKLIFQHRLFQSLDEVKKFMDAYGHKMPAYFMPEQPANLMEALLNHIVIGLPDGCTESMLTKDVNLMNIAAAYYLLSPEGYENQYLQDSLKESEAILRNLEVQLQDPLADDEVIEAYHENYQTVKIKVLTLRQKLEQERVTQFVEYRFSALKDEAIVEWNEAKAARSDGKRQLEPQRFFKDYAHSSDEELETRLTL